MQNKCLGRRGGQERIACRRKWSACSVAFMMRQRGPLGNISDEAMRMEPASGIPNFGTRRAEVPWRTRADLPGHSERRATMGSTLVALRAGA